MLAAILSLRGHEAFVVTGESNISERERIIRLFRSSENRALVVVNYGVLTTGIRRSRNKRSRHRTTDAVARSVQPDGWQGDAWHARGWKRQSRDCNGCRSSFARLRQCRRRFQELGRTFGMSQREPADMQRLDGRSFPRIGREGHARQRVQEHRLCVGGADRQFRSGRCQQCRVICFEEYRQVNERSSRRIQAIGILDNGDGMTPETLRLALQFGNGTHLSDRKGIGRFGMGLPPLCQHH